MIVAEETEVQATSLGSDKTEGAEAVPDEPASGQEMLPEDASGGVEEEFLSGSSVGEVDGRVGEDMAEEFSGESVHQVTVDTAETGSVTRSRQQSDGLPDAAMEALLSAAETANRIAQGAEQLGARLQSSGVKLAKASERASALHMRTLLSFGVAMAAVLLVFAFMSIQLSGRIAALNSTVVAIGERVVRLSAGLQDLASVREGLSQVAAAQRTMADTQAELRAAMEESMVQNAALPELIPAQVSPQLRADLEAGVAVVSRQVGVLSEAVGNQNQTLADYSQSLDLLQRRIQELDRRSASIGRLEQDLQALVTLTRERYLEAMRALSVEEAPAMPATLRYPPKAPSPSDGEEGS